MDIYCRYCGEPWDNDELHDMEEHIGESMSYLEAVRRFKALGCRAFRPDTGRLRELAGLPSKPKHCTASSVLHHNMLRYIADSQDSSDYPDEWESPADIMFMLEVSEVFLDIEKEMFK